MTVVNKEALGHFYTREGLAAYESKMQEIREHGYLPSPTTILGAASAFNLTRWQREQVGIAAWKNPPTGNEMKVWINERLEEADQVTKQYADFGSNFHDGAEAILLGNEWDESDPWLIKFEAWARANVIDVKWTEATLVHPSFLFAGRADALVDHQEHGTVLLDFKTRRLKRLKSGKFTCSSSRYDKDIRQLAAYADCIQPKPQVMNIYIHRDEPADPVEYLWPQEKQAEGLDAFMALAEYWCLDKKYDPRKWVAEQEVAA